MKINIDSEIISDIHGDDVLEAILDNIDIIEKNADILKEYNFKDIESIFEMYPTLLMNFPSELKEKLEKLHKKYGENFVGIIEDDISILETIVY